MYKEIANLNVSNANYFLSAGDAMINFTKNNKI